MGALLLLVVCKGLAYTVSLGSFRGGPIFPALFIGAAGGIAMSHLPGLPLVAGLAMGMGAMTVVMMTLPLTSVLLPALLLPVQRAHPHPAGHRGGRGGPRHRGAAGAGPGKAGAASPGPANRPAGAAAAPRAPQSSADPQS